MNSINKLSLNDDIDPINPFEPFYDMYLDTVSIADPYLTRRAFLLNLLQPLLGGLNILKAALLGGLSLIGLGLSIPVAVLYDPTLLVMNVGWILTNVTLAIRGATQIVATPLTWGIKMPIRLLSTLFHSVKGDTDEYLIERSTEVQNMRASRDIEGLHKRFMKGVARGEATNIDEEIEDKIYQTVGYDPTLNHGNGGFGYGDSLSYFGLFSGYKTREYELKTVSTKSLGATV